MSGLPEPFARMYREAGAAMEPRFPVGTLNPIIPLYQGRLEFEQGATRIAQNGTIRFEWFPSPRVTLRLEDIGEMFPDVDEAAVLLDDGRSLPRVLITEFQSSNRGGEFSQGLSGIVACDLQSQDDCDLLSSLRFHLPNFRSIFGTTIISAGSTKLRADRFELKAAGWLVTVDQVDHPPELQKSLKSMSGYLVTHVGDLRREDGTKFSLAEGQDQLAGLASYLSFANGFWTGPILHSGHDATGALVYESWRIPRLATWRSVMGWIDDRGHAAQLSDSFPGYMRLWNDPEQREIIQFATHWYVEANGQFGAVEGALVLAQAAFELLAGVAQDSGWTAALPPGAPASARLRRLLNWAHLPLAVPSQLEQLTTLLQAMNWEDAPRALTEIRNPLTHPTSVNRERFRRYAPPARNEAWRLGLWYLELCLLRLCDYNGTYASRVRERYSGDVDPVPWATSPP